MLDTYRPGAPRPKAMTKPPTLLPGQHELDASILGSFDFGFRHCHIAARGPSSFCGIIRSSKWLGLFIWSPPPVIFRRFLSPRLVVGIISGGFAGDFHSLWPFARCHSLGAILACMGNCSCLWRGLGRERVANRSPRPVSCCPPSSLPPRPCLAVCSIVYSRALCSGRAA